MNPRLIRLIASQYHEMQGLLTIADAAWPLGYAAFLAYARSAWDAVLAVPVIAVCLWKRHTWLPDRVEEFYDSRCGRTGWHPRELPYTFFFMQGVSAASGATDMGIPRIAGAALLMAMFGFMPAIVVARDAPYRLHWGVPLVIGVMAAVQYATLPAGAAAGAWEKSVALWGSAGIAFAGLMDHLLLLRTLTPGSSSEVSGRA